MPEFLVAVGWLRVRGRRSPPVLIQSFIGDSCDSYGTAAAILRGKYYHLYLLDV